MVTFTGKKNKKVLISDEKSRRETTRYNTKNPKDSKIHICTQPSHIDWEGERE